MILKSLPFKVEKCFQKDLLEMNIPHSKSYANRLLVLAAIDKEDVTLSGVPQSTDVQTMLKCFEEIGLKVVRDENKVTIIGSFPECESLTKSSRIQIETGDGGTTNRFILPFLARGEKEYELIPEGHMRNRPMEPLVQALRELEIQVNETDDVWLSVKGPYRNQGKVQIDCSDSTQFLTGLALATVDKEILITPQNLEASLLYWKITEKLLAEFKSKNMDYKIPVDFSGASYPLALGATIRPVCIKNCFQKDPLQADASFLDFLSRMGVTLSFSNNGLLIEPPKQLKGIEVDGSLCPDLMPTLAFVCSYAKSESKLLNLGILRHKESDRVSEIEKLLKTFEISYELDKDDNLIIFGGKEIDREVEYYPAADHRIVMVAYLFMSKNAGGLLYNSGHVAKSFPHFFKEMS